MKQLNIVWKRLVKGGQTCTRCGDTGNELQAAVDKLATALRPLGIEPVLEKQELDEASFQKETSESNRVWMAGKPIEAWLGAAVGMSPCCSVCGDSPCRTLTVDGRTFETIPQEQFLKAGLLAASELLATTPSSPTATAACGAPAGSGHCAPAQKPTQGGCCGA